MVVGNGYLKLTGITFIKDTELESESVAVIDEFESVLKRQSGLSGTSSKAFRFTLDKTLKDEAYKLVVNNKGVKIAASSKAGFFYAIQTIKQLLPIAIYGGEPEPKASWALHQW